MMEGCNKRNTEFKVYEITEIKDPSLNSYYLKIQFEGKHLNTKTTLKSIGIGNLSIYESYLVNESNSNSIESWKEHRISDLPIDVEEGKKYSVVLESKNPEILTNKEIEFHYRYKGKNLLFTYNR